MPEFAHDFVFLSNSLLNTLTQVLQNYKKGDSERERERHLTIYSTLAKSQIW